MIPILSDQRSIATGQTESSPTVAADGRTEVGRRLRRGETRPRVRIRQSVCAARELCRGNKCATWRRIRRSCTSIARICCRRFDAASGSRTGLPTRTGWKSTLTRIENLDDSVESEDSIDGPITPGRRFCHLCELCDLDDIVLSSLSARFGRTKNIAAPGRELSEGDHDRSRVAADAAKALWPPPRRRPVRFRLTIGRKPAWHRARIHPSRLDGSAGNPRQSSFGRLVWDQ